MNLDLSHLDSEQRAALAALWGAPSSQPDPLARFLTAPIQIKRRIAALSAQSRDALKAMAEATAPNFPLEALPQGVGEELAAMLLARLGGAEAPRVALLDECAQVATEVLGATPCRLYLLLHALDAQGLQTTLDALGGPQPGSFERPAAQIARRLTEPDLLAGVLAGLPAEADRVLQEIVARGGLMPARQAEQDAEDPGRGVLALIERGLLWLTPHDARIPVEVLRALLLVRLRQQAHRVAARLKAIGRAQDADKIRPFPSAAGRWLAHAAAALGAHAAGSPVHEGALPALLDAAPGPDLDARLLLALAAGLLDRQGDQISIGALAQGAGWNPSGANPSGANPIGANPIGAIPSGSGRDGSGLAGAAPLGQRAAQQLVDRVVIGEPHAPIAAAARAIYGPDALPDEGPLGARLDPAGRRPAEAPLDELGAAAPHLLTPDEAAELPSSAHGDALRLLRALLQHLLAELPLGALVSRAEIEAASDALAGVARAHQRVLGNPYARDHRPPSAHQRNDALEVWLRALAIPLGWLRPEGQAHPDEGVSAEPAPRPDALPLFDLIEASWRDGAPRAETRRSGPDTGLDWMRAAVRAPAPSPEAAGLLHLSGPQREALAPLLDLLSPSGAPSAPALAADAVAGGAQIAADLDAQLLAAIASATDSDKYGIELLRDFAQGQTTARRLQDLRPDDFERFVTCWLRLDAPARSIPRLRPAFDGLQAVERWARDQGALLSVDVQGLRARLEGHLLRTLSAEAAFRARQPATAPPDLLKVRPERAWDGLSAVVSLDPARKQALLKPFGRDDLPPLLTRTIPEPLHLLRPGDLVDAQLIRYDEVCWLARLRRILVAEAGRHL